MTDKLAQSKLFRVAASLSVALLAPAGAAWACAVCGGGDHEESRKAFILTTGLLSAIPLVSIGGIVGLLYRLARKRQDEEAA